VEDAEGQLDVAGSVGAALSPHPAVRELRLVGSRAEGRAHRLSDWDFAVETDDFDLVARDLPALVATLRPLAEQWDRYSSYPCYMLILRGPVKVDLLFLGEPWESPGTWNPTAETLEALDRHFWDWILWLEQKRRGHRDEVLAKGLGQMHELLLEPMGVARGPVSVPDAVDAYVDARSELERRFGVSVPRELEREVRPVVAPKPS
jgi:hypothetical protein